MHFASTIIASTTVTFNEATTRASHNYNWPFFALFVSPSRSFRLTVSWGTGCQLQITVNKGFCGQRITMNAAKNVCGVKLECFVVRKKSVGIFLSLFQTTATGGAYCLSVWSDNNNMYLCLDQLFCCLFLSSIGVSSVNYDARGQNCVICVFGSW